MAYWAFSLVGRAGVLQVVSKGQAASGASFCPLLLGNLSLGLF